MQYLNGHQRAYIHIWVMNSTISCMDMSRRWVSSFFLLAISLCILVSGQAITSLTNCSCSPLTYKLRLNLSLTCPPYNVTMGPDSGVQRLFCQISSSTNGVNNLTPTSITEYRIIELSQSLSPIKVKSVSNVTLQSGSYISFESTTLFNSSVVTGGIQISMSGLNIASNPLTLNIILQYTNRCGVLPFNFGSSLGWIEFEGDLKPLTGSCLLTSPPTPCPLVVFEPSQQPSTAPPTISFSPFYKPSTIAPSKFKKKKKSKGKEARRKKLHLPRQSQKPMDLSMKWNIFDKDETVMLMSKLSVANITF